MKIGTLNKKNNLMPPKFIALEQLGTSSRKFEDSFRSYNRT